MFKWSQWFRCLKKVKLLARFLLLNLLITSLPFPEQLVFADSLNPELSERQITAIADAIKKIDPKFDIKSSTIGLIADSNIYKIISNNNGEVFYLSKDNRYFFYGDLIDLNNNNHHTRNITELSKMLIRKAEMDQFPTSKMIVFKAKNNWPKKPVEVITVFTDLDCPYGNRLYKELEKATESGMEVRYLLFPRQGLGSESYKKAVSVWCAKNRNKAFSMANNGETIIPATCKSDPIESQFNLAVKMGIHGTPSIILTNGRIIPGYVNYETLLNLLKENNAHSAS